MPYYLNDSTILPGRYRAASPIDALLQEFKLQHWDHPVKLTVVWEGPGYHEAPEGLYAMFEIERSTYLRRAMLDANQRTVLRSFHIRATDP